MKNTERFSNRVENYVKYRPGYPKELLDYLFTEAGFSKESIVADIGSGTGIFSALLLERGCRVAGVEPNKEMRKAAEALLEEYKKFVSLDGTAENTGLANNSVDFVICAQAFHWFDKAACKKEFERILKPGGKVVLIWNSRKDSGSDFASGYEDLLRAYANDYNEVNHVHTVTYDTLSMFYRDGKFTKEIFENYQLFDLEGLKGRLLSSSYVPLPGETSYEAMMTGLEKLFNKCESNGKISFDYITEVYVGYV